MKWQQKGDETKQDRKKKNTNLSFVDWACKKESKPFEPVASSGEYKDCKKKLAENEKQAGLVKPRRRAYILLAHSSDNPYAFLF